MVEDVVADVVVAVLLLATFVVAAVGGASPAVADMAAEVEASVADLVVMVVVHLHMEAGLLPTVEEEDMAEAMVTQAAPRMVHPPGGKSAMPIQHHSMHREHLFPSISFGSFTTALAHMTGACCKRGVVNFHSRIRHDTTLAIFHSRHSMIITIDSVDFTG